MRVYFDLCSEEFYLYKDGLIDKRVWNEWEEGIIYPLTQKPYFVGCQIAKMNFKFFKDFEERALIKINEI